MILFHTRFLAGMFLSMALALTGFAINFKSCFSTNNAAAIRWPVAAKLARAQQLPTLVVFLHPHCHNSTATMNELEQLLPALKGRVQVYITIYSPDGKEDNWVKKAIWRQAQKMQNVNIYLDKNGEDSEMFGAQSSGETFLYDTSGDLVFHGGITRPFGIASENRGAESIVAWVMNQYRQNVAYETPVWGRNVRNEWSFKFLDKE